MQGYSLAETRQSSQLHLVERPAAAASVAAFDESSAALDQLLAQLADFVADRIAARLIAPQRASADDWLDTRRAAEYLGIGRNRLRRLAAERTIPTEQAGAGCKLFFRRSDLDAWRCSGASQVVAVRGQHHD